MAPAHRYRDAVEFQDVVRRRRLGACFFGIPVDRIGVFREAFGVPPQFTPIGAISIGYSDEPPRDVSSRRRPLADVVHRGRWGRPAG
jgi:nitroreductase